MLLQERRDNARISLVNFYLRRSIRIMPVAYAFILVLFVLTLTTDLKVSGCQFATAITFTKNYGCASWIDGHLWSLAVEEQFYLVWPLVVARLPPRLAVGIAIAGIMISPTARAVEYLIGHRTLAWLPSNTDALMCGALAAYAAHYKKAFLIEAVSFKPFVLRVLCVAVMLLPVALSNRMLLGWFTVTLGPLLQAICATYLICSYAYIHHGWGFRMLNTRVLAYTGMLSYSLYIWQQPIMTEARIYGLDQSWALIFPVNLILLLAIAAASYHFLERPLVKLRARLRPTASSYEAPAPAERKVAFAP